MPRNYEGILEALQPEWQEYQGRFGFLSASRTDFLAWVARRRSRKMAALFAELADYATMMEGRVRRANQRAEQMETGMGSESGFTLTLTNVKGISIGGQVADPVAGVRSVSVWLDDSGYLRIDAGANYLSIVKPDEHRVMLKIETEDERRHKLWFGATTVAKEG